MPTEPKNKTSNQEEIDLLYIFVKLGEFLKNALVELIRLIGSILVFLLRKSLYFVLAILLTILAAVLINRISEPIYHSQLIMRSNASSNQSIMSHVTKLGEYAEAGNFAALSKKLELSIEEASEIKRIESFWYYDIGDDGIIDGIDIREKFISDTSITKIDSLFSLQVQVTKIDILEKLESNMVHFLESNDFLQALNKQRLADLEGQMAQIDYEILKLDSLQKREYFTNPDELRQKEGQIVFTSENVVRMYHNQMFDLLHQRQDCEREMNLFSGVVTVLEGFHEPVEADNGVIYLFRKLIWYALGLAIIFALLISFRKELLHILKAS
jgi:hypothetical protein